MRAGDDQVGRESVQMKIARIPNSGGERNEVEVELELFG